MSETGTDCNLAAGHAQERAEEIEALRDENERLESLVAEHQRIRRELVGRLQDSRHERAREGIRAAAQVPLLWGRGDYSLGYSIHQHILSLIDEHNPDWGFKVLHKSKIEKLIEERGYVGHAHRFNPRPRPFKLLWIWLKGIAGK